MPGAPHFMSSVLPLRAAITRGALITLANWPTVLIDFIAESIYKLALAVPVIGGAFMVALLMGADIQTLLADGVAVAAERMLGPLGQAPIALLAFLSAVGVVAFGGEILMFIVKSGTLAVLVQGERTAGEVHRTPIRLTALRTAAAYTVDSVLQGARRFQRRAALLAAWLGGVYVLIGAAWVMAVNYGFQWAAASPWASVWPLLVVLATSVSAVSLTAANLIFDLMRVVIITDDCRVSDAARRVRTFLLADARQVLGIFGVMALLHVVATRRVDRWHRRPERRGVGAAGGDHRAAATARILDCERLVLSVCRTGDAVGLPDAVPPFRVAKAHRPSRRRCIKHDELRTVLVPRGQRDEGIRHPADGQRVVAVEGHGFLRARISG